MYKKNRFYIDKHGNSITEKEAKGLRLDYYHLHPFCESCGVKSYLSVHHHIKSQFQYHGEVYSLELEPNYSVLCLDCHQHIHASSNQYERNHKLVPKRYWCELKDGNLPDYYIEKYLAKQEIPLDKHIDSVI